jgi:hypothetical protein
LLGLDEVPCIVLAHLTPAPRRAYMLADNKLALNAGWDLEMLSLEIGELGVTLAPRRRNRPDFRWGHNVTLVEMRVHVD